MIFFVLLYITLTWTDTSHDETYFTIERCQVLDIAIECAPYTFLAKMIVDTNSYVDDNVLPLTMYCYRVNAGNEIGVSEWSNISCSTTPNAPPLGPSGLQVNETI